MVQWLRLGFRTLILFSGPCLSCDEVFLSLEKRLNTSVIVAMGKCPCLLALNKQWQLKVKYGGKFSVNGSDGSQ